MNSWLKNAIFYEIYPISFFDSNGDGKGDLPGITNKLSYVKDLGANAIWFNPFYPSPFMDGGYDVTDYYAIHPDMGTMADFEEMVVRAKELGIRVIIDLVIGHTSFKHPWFLESGKDEINKYTDWYIWGVWGYNIIRGLFPRPGGYLTNYYACQPALNYGYNRLDDTPATGGYDNNNSWKMHYTDPRLKPLREEILNIMRFWLHKGVDGFRVDMANSLVKGCVYNSPRDEDIEGLRWLWNILIGSIKKEYPDAAFIAEWVCPSNSVGKCGFDLDFLAHDQPGYNDLFRNEPNTNIARSLEQGNSYFREEGRGTLSRFLDYTTGLHKTLDGKGYFTIPSGYHDIIRVKYLRDEEMMKVIFAFLLTFKHVPFIYYGDEIGMDNRFGINKDGGYSRTGCRTPMQWTNGKNRGFSETDGELYLPVNNALEQSVESQEGRKDSLLHFVRTMINLRKEKPALNAAGEYEIVSCENGGYPFIYRRSDGESTFFVALNPSTSPCEISLKGEILLSQNVIVEDNRIILSGKSFAIIEA